MVAHHIIQSHIALTQTQIKLSTLVLHAQAVHHHMLDVAQWHQMAATVECALDCLRQMIFTFQLLQHHLSSGHQTKCISANVAVSNSAGAQQSIPQAEIVASCNWMM